MAAEMMSREGRLCILAFAAMTVVVTFNLVFFQGKRNETGFETASLGGPSATIASAEPREGVAEQVTAEPSAGAADLATSEPERQAPSMRSPANAAAAPAPVPAVSRLEMSRAIQRGLGALGYEPGQPDGIVGLMTRAAIMAYEADSGLALTGEPSEALMRRLALGPSAPIVTRKGAIEVKNAEAAAIVKSVGQWLAALGYPLQKNEITMSAALVRAIRDFEASQKLPETGRISAPLVARLSRAGQGKMTAAR